MVLVYILAHSSYFWDGEYILWVDGQLQGSTHRGADLVSHSEVESALLIHGVVDAGEFRKLRPVVFERVIQQTIIGAVRE